MKHKLFTILLVFLSLVGIGSKAFGQSPASGDYVFTLAGTTSGSPGDWRTNGNWSISDGAGGYSSSGVAFPNANTANVWIPAGTYVNFNTTTTACKNLYVYGTLTNGITAGATLNVGSATDGNVTVYNGGTFILYGTLDCNNITVNTGGVLRSSTSYTSNKSIMLGYGGGSIQTGSFTIQNDGQFGGTATGTNDGIGIFYSEKASTITIQGSASGTSGTAYLARIMANNGTGVTSGTLPQTLNINQNLTLALNSGGIAFSLQNNKDQIYSRTCNINAGYTVKFANGNCRFHANATHPTANEGNITYNIYGTLDLGTNNGDFSLFCTSNTSCSTQSVTVNVKSGGTLKLGSTIRLYNAQGTQSASINPEAGSNVTYGGTSAISTFLSGSGVNSMSASGTGYSTAPTLTISGGGGTGATGTVTTSGSSPNITVTGVTITYPGSGYTSIPTVTFSSGNAAASNIVLGSGATPTLPASYSDLTLNNTNGFTVPVAWNVSGNLNLTAGTLTNTTNNITLGDNASIVRTAGSLSAAPVFGASVDLTYNGSSAQTASYEVPSSSSVLKNLTISNTNGVTFGSALSMKGNLSMTGNLNGGYGVTFSGTSQTLDAGGKTISGNLVVNSGSTVTTNASNISYIAGDVNVSGTLTNGKQINCKNITVNSGGVLNSSLTGNTVNGVLVGFNGTTESTGDYTITNNGTLGSSSYGGTGSGLRFFYSSLATSLTISGTGISNVGAILPTKTVANTDFTLNLNQSISFCKSDAACLSLQDNGVTTGYTRTCNIAAGKTVTLGGKFHANAAVPVSNLGNMTYNIYGTLDLGTRNAEFDLMCTNFAGNAQQLSVNVKNGGSLMLGSVVKLYNEITGQSAFINPEYSSNVTYGGSGTSSITLYGGGGATVPTLPSAYTNLTFSNSNGVTIPNDFSVSGNLTMNENVTTGTVNLLASSNATLTAGKIFTATALNLESSSSGTATFVNNGTATITTTSVQQYLPDARNWYVSSPVSNALAPSGYTYYRYNEGAANWTASPVVVGDALTPGTGYIALPGFAGSTITFTTQASGILNSGNVDITLTRSGATKTGFNLIGNPYPAHLTWNKTFVDSLSTVIEPTIWYRTNAGTTNNSGQWSFKTYNASSDEASPMGTTNIVPPMQAFWVRALQAGTLTLNGRLVKSHQTSNPLKARAATNTDRQRIRLQVSNGISTDETVIYFDALASNGLDAYDSQKMSNNSASIPEIYTTVNSEKLVINGMSSLTNNIEVPVGFTTGQANTFVIKAIEMANIASGTQLFLRDNQNNNLIELNLNEDYSFNSDISDNNSRFTLIFKSPSITTDNSLTENNLVRVFSNENNQIMVESNLNVNNATMLVHNATGQLLQSVKITENLTTSKNSYPSGIYFITVCVGDKKETSKLVINN